MRSVLITGGARSGKSTFAQKLAEEAGKKKLYIATMHVFDEEMAERVLHHQADRSDKNYDTVEEELDLPLAIRHAAEAKYEVILVECLTLWINNLLYRAEQGGYELDDESMMRYCGELQQAVMEFPGTVIMVINEVGLGIVPENKRARRFRDLSGRCGQSIGAWVDEIYLTVCGRQLKIK